MCCKGQEGSRRVKKVQEGSRRFKKVQDSSKCFKKVSRRFYEGSRIKGPRIF